MITVDLPDGTSIDVDTDDEAVAVAAARKYLALLANPSTPPQQVDEPLIDRAKRVAESALTSETANDFGRAGGTVARGVMGLPAMAMQAGQEAWNLTAPAQAKFANMLGMENITPDTLRIAPENMALTNLYGVTTRGGPPPTGSGIVEGGLGALTGAGFARSAAVAAKSPALKNLAQTLGSNRVLQGVSGMTGAGAAEGAREAGAGPVGQVVAGVAGAMAPGAAITGARNAIAGDAAAVAERQKQFARAGVSPTVGQVTQQRSTQGAESLISKAPGGVGKMTEFREAQQDDLAAKVDVLADRLGNVTSGERAGEIIVKGLTGEGGFVDRFQQAQKIAYDKLDSLIPPQMRVVPQQTLDTLDFLAAPIAGARATTGGLVNAKVKTLRDDILTDIRSNAQPSVSGAPGVAGIPYEALASIRSRVGAMLGQDEAISGAPRAELKRIYAALSQDMKAAAVATGDPKALQAFNRANSLTKAGHQRIDDVLQSVIDKKLPEIVYRSATNMADMKLGASKIRTVLKSLKPEEADAVRGMFLRQLGKATGSNQNAAGDQFSSETFLTNWASKISPEAKTALFGRGQMRADLDAIAKTADDIRASNRAMGNPGGTAQNVAPYIVSSAAAGAAGSGNYGVAGLIVLQPLIANAGARLMTNQKFVRWLANEIKTPQAAYAAGSLQGLLDIMKDQPKSVQDDVNAYVSSVEGQGE